jgi:hypothetical protein
MTQTTVVELPARTGLAAQIGKQMQRGLMVAWINADLANRGANDVDRSQIFYDADGDFLSAIPGDTWDRLAEESQRIVLQALYDENGVRFTSRGLR